MDAKKTWEIYVQGWNIMVERTVNVNSEMFPPWWLANMNARASNATDAPQPFIDINMSILKKMKEAATKAPIQVQKAAREWWLDPSNLVPKMVMSVSNMTATKSKEVEMLYLANKQGFPDTQQGCNDALRMCTLLDQLSVRMDALKQGVVLTVALHSLLLGATLPNTPTTANMLYAALAAWPDVNPVFYWRNFDGNVAPTIMPTQRESLTEEVLDATCPSEG